MSRQPMPQPKRVRVSENPVSHELEHVVLDAPQKAFERICAFADAEARKLSNGDAMKLGALLQEYGRRMQRHSEGG